MAITELLCNEANGNKIQRFHETFPNRLYVMSYVNISQPCCIMCMYPPTNKLLLPKGMKSLNRN